MPNTLYLLIGPKGAGKSHIGALISRHTSIHFLLVEPLWLSLQPGEDGWQKVEAAIDTLLTAHPTVMIESLGVGDGFRAFHARLAQKYRLRLIRVRADPETCLARVQSRSRADHIPVSMEQVQAYNRLAAEVAYAWDLEIDNNHPQPEADLINAFLALQAADDHAHAAGGPA